MWHRRLALLTILIASGQAGGDATQSGRARYHMRENLSDLRKIERLVVANRLAEAKTLAYMVARSARTLPQSTDVSALLDASQSLGNAKSIAEAAHAEVRVAQACAQCHMNAQQLPVFRMPVQAPPDRPDLGSQMTRYQWAVDRLWEGMLGASDLHWRAGMYVLATSSLPHTTPAAPALAKQLQLVAQADLDRHSAPTLQDRADTYTRVLLTCAECHARWHR